MSSISGVEAIVFFLVQTLTGFALWSLKTAYQDLKKQNEKLDDELQHVRETYFKKEDWKDFRDELWNRLDKMERVFEEKLKESKRHE